MSDYMSGDEIRAIRRALGLTQAELAEHIGLSRTFVGLMERGKKLPSKRTILAIRSLKAPQLDHLSTETDPSLRRLENALISHGIEFTRGFRSHGYEFDFYLRELSLAIIVDREASMDIRPTPDVRDIIIATGAGAADIVAVLLEGRSLRTALPPSLKTQTLKTSSG